MTAPVLWRDLSPYPGELTPEDHDWLQRLSRRDIQDFVVHVGSDGDADEWSPIVERRSDGRWWAGRYIGALTFEGRRLIIEPRLGVTVIEAWLDQIFGLLATPASAQHVQTEAFIVRLLARLWCRTIDAATRHGLPLLRLPRSHEGLFVRGRFDVVRTTTLMGEGREIIASTTHDRSLSHPVTRAIVCADRALGALLTDSAEWRTERVRQTLPPLRGAVGARPRLPSLYNSRVCATHPSRSRSGAPQSSRIALPHASATAPLRMKETRRESSSMSQSCGSSSFSTASGRALRADCASNTAPMLVAVTSSYAAPMASTRLGV